MPNRLAGELSPYLLQHKDNPVDWQPWGEEAFAAARAKDRPIFLSIGYSTCHWCHVMEHESFENPGIAQALNDNFVSIKVDREERPDVDRVYMMFVQATTGSGGWPMSVWLTPSLEPFYGGTYFPPASRWGRPGFLEVLQEVARVWRDEREKVVQSAATIVERLESLQTAGRVGAVPGVETLSRAVTDLSEAFDERRGGFGNAPKFPRPSEILFLLREHARTGTTRPRDMALSTLRAMALGGMRDHVGGGFHRYSVDADWRVPHFEKMLYDQAQLVLAYLEASQASGDPFYRNVALDTLDYVRRDLTHPDGGFYSAEDADSIPPEDAGEPAPHKREGAFYVWRDDEIGDVLGGDADVFRMRFGVRPDGNAPFDPQSEFTGRNLLYAAQGIEEIAAATGRGVPEVQAVLANAREVLRHRRSSRPRPHLDDKVLTAWNGLMIAAFARAARSVSPVGGGGEHPGVEPEAVANLEAAQDAARFVHRHLWNPADRTLRRRFRNGETGVDGYAEDYAFLIFGLLELFQSDGNPEWLEWAIDLQRTQNASFLDASGGGWFSTSGRDPSVLLRLKDEYDGAEPSATSVSLLNLMVLAHVVGDEAREPDAMSFGALVERTLASFGAGESRSGRAVPMFMAALSSYHAGVTQLVIAGDPDAADTRSLSRVAAQQYHPAMVLVPLVPRHRAALVRRLPWTGAMDVRDGHAAAYLCRRFACQTPASSADRLREQLQTT